MTSSSGSSNHPYSLLDAWNDDASNWNANQCANPQISIVLLTTKSIQAPIKQLCQHFNLSYLRIDHLNHAEIEHELLNKKNITNHQCTTFWLVSFDHRVDTLAPGQVSISFDDSSSEDSVFKICIKYYRLIEAFRGLGHILASKCTTSTRPSPDYLFDGYTETAQFTRSGLMLDCSRGSVPLLKTVYLIIRYLALLGINTLLLYTEDTYEVQDEPFFGYLRGRFTQAELKAVDDYAYMFGIEVIPCIQTLGHLGQILQWPAYAHLRDTHEVLLVYCTETLNFIEKLIRAATQPFRSNKIHLGMDECAGLGDGRYKQYFPSNEINRSKLFLDHLHAVVQICCKLGKEPLIWSDMLFCLPKEDVSLQGYYESPTAITPTSCIEPVFWSYYSTSPAHYTERIEVHQRDLKKDPWVASGIWTWNRLWTALPFTFQAIQACLTAARSRFCGGESDAHNRYMTKNNVLATIWGDDGNEHDLYSTFPALIYFAHGCYARPMDSVMVDPSHNKLTAWFAGVFGGKLEDWLHASRLDNPSLSLAPQSTQIQFPGNMSKWLLWEDPLYAHLSGQAPSPDRLTQTYTSIYDTLQHATSKSVLAKYPFNQYLAFPCAHAKVLKYKAGLRERLRQAYLEGDATKLQDLCVHQIQSAKQAVSEMWILHRRIWMSRNQPFGWEILDLRYGGISARLDTLQYRITAFLDKRETDEIQHRTSRIHLESNDDMMGLQDDHDATINAFDVTYDDLAELVPETLVVWEGAGDQVLVDFARAFTPMRALGTGFDPKESVTGQTQTKSSVQRTIKSKIIQSYPKIEPYLDDIIPKKSPLNIVKCQDRIQLLSIDNVPLFFNHFDGPWMPTLRILHKYPFMMHAVQVDRGAIKFILSSANIMCPGLTSKGAWMPTEVVPSATPVAVFAEGKSAPLAIGMLKMSTDQIRTINKDIGCDTLHHLGDGLWKTTCL